MKFLAFAHKLAESSLHPVHKMAAVAYRGGSVLSQAVNGAHTGRHAEIRCLAHDIDFCKASLLIVRNNGDKTSKPCRTCYLLAKQVGIRRLFFYEAGIITMSDTRYSNELYYRDYEIQKR